MAGDWIRIGDARIGAGAATGRANDAEWDLRFTGAEVLRHLPLRWLYRAPLPRTKPVSVHPVARFDGTVRVRRPGDRAVRLAGDGRPQLGHPARRAVDLVARHGFRRHGRGRPGSTSPSAGSTSPAGYSMGRERRDRLVGERWRSAAWAGRGGRGWRSRRTGWSSRSPGGDIVRGRHGVGTARAHRRLGLRRPGRLRAPHGQLLDRRPHARVARPDRAPLNLHAAGLAAYELGMRERDHGIPIQPFSDG